MKYSELKKDLFSVSNDYYLAHCISADAKMGAGIAVAFTRRFNLTETRQVANQGGLIVGSTFRQPHHRVYNLITKEKYWYKPTYTTLKNSLIDLKNQMIRSNHKKIAMPKIGSGLDKLEWNQVRQIIQDVFQETNIEIVVCYI